METNFEKYWKYNIFNIFCIAVALNPKVKYFRFCAIKFEYYEIMYCSTTITTKPYSTRWGR